jgi:hypothetical protein
LQAKILKGAEEIHVERDAFRATVVAITTIITFACVDRTQSTCEEELREYNPHAIWVRNG